MNTGLKTWTKRVVVFLVTAAMAIALIPFTGLKTVTKAADSEYPVPATSKQLIDNEDGTYTLKLSVTGSAKTETENPKVNVVFIMDRSGSMQNQQAYTGQSGYRVFQYGRYGHVGTEYPQLYYRNNNGTYSAVGNNDNHATVYTRSGTAGNYTYTQYNGTRYNEEDNMRRDWIAIAAASDLADNLLSYNTAANPDIVEMAFVSFNDMATNGNNGNWTTSASTAQTVIRGYTGQNNTGTNWEDALIHAKALADNKADDADQEGEQMFIIFLTDGNPTRYVNDQGGREGSGSESDADNVTTCYNEAAPRARALTNAGYELYNIGVFGSVSRMENLTAYANGATAEGHGTATYYAAANASALEAAFAEILRSITDTLSLADVKFTDGVTDMTHSTGVNGMPGNFQYTITVNGVEEPWADAPAATVNANKEVIWDLSKDKDGEDLIIADGVTVTCSFLVWPDQDAMDLIADLNNNKVTYDSLTPAQKAQIVGTTLGNYALKTNTQAKLDYSILEDRDGDVHKIPQEPIILTPPDPMPMFIDKLSLEKKWDDSLDPDQREEVQGQVKLDFYKDNTKYILPGYEDGITLTEAENWIKTDFLSIATGIMVSEESPAYDADQYPVVTYDGKTYCILETGHDYHFQEQNINDHYELTAYTYHPMLVDGVLHNLFFEKEDGEIIGVTEGTEISTVSATNTIKGGVSITKKVVDEDGNEVDSDDPFTMTMHMVTPDGEPYSYDYRIYYGEKNPEYESHIVYNEDGTIKYSRTDHIYGEGDATVTIYPGDEIRFVNVNDDTRYYVEEADAQGYDLNGITYKIRYGDDPTLKDFTDDQKVTIDGKTYYIMQGNSSAAVEVTNIIKKGNLQVTKTVVVPEGFTKDTNKEFEFTFKLTDSASSEELTGTYDYTITTADGTKTTGTIAAGGTFKLKDGEKILIEGLPESKYEITETPVAGYTTTSTGATGNIVANETATAAFTNSYSVEPVPVSFPVTKILSVPEGLDGPEEWEYTINVAANNGAPQATTMTGKVNKTTTTVTFGPISYDTPGTYTYTVSETGTVAGVSNDPQAAGKTVTVTVVDNGNGTLTATATSTEEEPLTFTNTYNAEPTTVEFPVTKILSVPEGLDGPEEWEYTINVAANNGAPQATTMTGTVSNTNDTVSFGPFRYTAPGTFTYTVSETGTVAGVSNDPQAAGKTVTVTVVDNGNGTLTATATSTEEEPLTFTNTYNVGEITVSFPVEKILSVPEDLDGPEEWEYTITVEAEDGAPEAETMTGTVDQTTTTVTFGPISYDTPGTYTYTVSETGTVAGVSNDPQAAGKTVTVTVTDDGAGNLTAEASSTTDQPLTFTNTYDAEPTTVEFPVKKILSVPEGVSGPKAWSYAIDVAAVDGAPEATVMTGTVNQTTDTANFGPFTYTAPGTYTYKVTETGTVAGVTNDAAATSGKTVTVTVVDNGDGTLTASADSTEEEPLTFTNTYNVGEITATIPVKKNVNAASGLTPADITGKFTFTLAGVDGAPMPATTTVVSGKAGEVVTFPDAITYTKEGTYKYTITESVTPGADTGGIDLETADPKQISVVVTDNGDGTLTAVVNGDVILEFNNPYNVEAIDIVIPVEKILEVPQGLTAPDITSKFTFTIATTNEAPLPTTTSITNPSATGGNMTFGDEATTGKITITAPGEYKYTITESGTVPGVTNDATATKEVTVTVTDKGDGTLDYKLDTTTVSFTNKYDVTPVPARIPVEKILEVGEDLSAPDITDAFTFTLTAADGTPMPAVTEYTNPDADGGDMIFGDITYTKPGTYTYTITETGTVDGVSVVGTSEKTIQIVVVDNSDGTMTATVNGGEKVTFTNEYKVGEATAEIPVNKMLEYKEGLTPGDITGKFTFTLTAADGTPMPETTSYTNPDPTGGKVTFGKITFVKPGEYTYTITETGSADGVTNDSEASKTVKISVVDNSDGTMTATVNDGKELEFINTYKVEPTTVSFPAKKILSKPEDAIGPDITGKYTFTLTAADGIPMPETTSYTNPDKDGGTVTFGEITYTAPGVYEYTVAEEGTVPGVTNDPAAAGKTVKVTVKDNGDGTMTATADSTDEAPVTFTNSYSYGTTTATPAVHKMLSFAEGLKPADITEKYTFTLEAVTEGAPMPEEGGEVVKNPAADGGTVSFGTITFAHPGTYEYKVTEEGTVPGVTNDPDEKTFKIVVTDQTDGTLKADIDYGNDEGHVTFINTYEAKPVDVDPPVQKIFSGEDAEKLYNNGKFTFTIEDVSDEGVEAPMPKNTSITNSSKYEFPGKTGFYEFGVITFEAPGTYKYKVTESGKMDGVTNDPEAETGKILTFVVTDDGEGQLVVSPTTDEVQVSFTNKYVPQTGDHNSNIALLLVLMGLALAAGGTSTILLKKSRKRD